MIDLLNEKTHTFALAAAARLLPPGRRGQPVNLSTLWRWILKGVRTASSGERIRLEAFFVRLGSRWITAAALKPLSRLANALTPRLTRPPPVVPRSPSARQRAKFAEQLRSGPASERNLGANVVAQTRA